MLSNNIHVWVSKVHGWTEIVSIEPKNIGAAALIIFVLSFLFIHDRIVNGKKRK